MAKGDKADNIDSATPTETESEPEMTPEQREAWETKMKAREEKRAARKRREKIRDKRKEDAAWEKEYAFLLERHLKWEARRAQMRKDEEEWPEKMAKRKYDDRMKQLHKDFRRAAHRMTLVRKEPPEEALLKAHGLYMQATVGDINIVKPGPDKQSERKKWEAWQSFKGMNKEDSMHEYVCHHNRVITIHGWRPMGHVWDKQGNWIPGRKCDLCEPLWEGWKPKPGWWCSDDETEEDRKKRQSHQPRSEIKEWPETKA